MARRTSRTAVAFGSFLLEPGVRLLSAAGAPIHLTRKALELLTLLADRQPQAVSKQEIHERLWPETFVAESNLAPLVFELRVALGETARRPRFIRTIHGYGYAFEPDPAPAQGPATCRLIIGGDVVELGPGDHLVGRSRKCAIRLESPKVSRVHARITVDGGGATLQDFGSRNGTLVRGARVSGAVALSDGDDVVFGSEYARFETSAITPGTETLDA